MDIELLITLVLAGIINAIIFAIFGIVAYHLIKKKSIKKILRKIFKI
jgi:hypothetical protein